MIAVVGAGHWGRNHVRNFAALGVLGAVCDASEEVLGRIREVYPEVATHADLTAVLADPRIDAVVLATPAAEHFSGARDALAAGRHVLVEKSMTLDVGEAETLARLAADQGLVLMVGHLLEYHPAFVALRDIVAAGELGEIIHIDSSRLSLGTFRHEEGVLWDLAPHDLSMILRLLGRMPESVLAVASSHVLPGVHDVATAVLAFAGDVQAQVLLSWLHPFKEHRLVVVGTQKMAVFDDVAKEGKLQVYSTHVTRDGTRAVAVSGEPEVAPYPQGEPLRAECEHFLHCIATGQRPLTDGANGVQVTRVVAACERSLRAGGMRVDLR